jgi:hypothetical protein
MGGAIGRWASLSRLELAEYCSWGGRRDEMGDYVIIQCPKHPKWKFTIHGQIGYGETTSASKYLKSLQHLAQSSNDT